MDNTEDIVEQIEKMKHEIKTLKQALKLQLEIKEKTCVKCKEVQKYKGNLSEEKYCRKCTEKYCKCGNEYGKRKYSSFSISL